MTDILTAERQPNRRATELGLDIMPAGAGEGFAAAFEEAFVRNPTTTALREIERREMADPFDRVQAGRGVALVPREDPPVVLSPEDATAQYGIPGRLTFDTETAEPVARQLNRLKREEIERQETMRRADTGVGTALTAGLIASLLDPINVASAFIPVVGPARFAALSARYGTTGARAVTGAVEGAVGAAVVEPIVLAGAMREQADYTAVDSLVNIAFGTALGGGLHLAAGAMADRLAGRTQASSFARTVDTLPRDGQEALLRTAVAQVAEGRRVDIEPVLRAVAELEPAVRAVERAPEGVFSLAQAFGRDVDAERLVQLEDLRADLETRLADLPPEPTPAQLEQAARLAEVERQLENPDLTVPEERALRRRRDELAAEADPAVQRQATATAEQRRAARARIENIKEEVGRIEERRRAGTVDGIPGMAARGRQDRLQAITEGVKRLQEERVPEPADARAAEAATVRAQKEPGEPKPLDDELADVEAEIAELDRFLPAESRAAMEGGDAGVKEANVFAKAWQEAAACRMRMS